MSLGQIRAAIEALPIMADVADATLAAEGVLGHVYSVEIGRQQVKAAVLQDIDDYMRAHAGTLDHQPPLGRRRPADCWAWLKSNRQPRRDAAIAHLPRAQYILVTRSAPSGVFREQSP